MVAEINERKYMKSVIVFSAIAAAILGLAGCGGGGGGSSATLPKLTTLSVFGDGAGVARAEQDGITMHIMTGDIQNQSLDGPDIAVDLSNLSSSGSNQYGEFYSGLVTINGVPVNLDVYASDRGESFIMYGFSGNVDALAAFGSKVSNIPTGSYQYLGTNIIGARAGGFAEVGTFGMTVNFSSGTAAITGTTARTAISGTGLSVNNSNGTFTGNNLTLTVNGQSTAATIHGHFHGNGAVGISGIYHDNAAIPVYAGAIAGSR
jgi:hypothetical protein